MARRRARPVGEERAQGGYLWPGASPPASPRLESFREGLREAGFIEGENLVIELRYSKQDFNIARSLPPSSCV